MGTRRKTILLVIVSILAIVVIGVFFALWNPTPPPVVPMPVPNGYTAIEQASTLVQKQTWDYDKMDAATLRSIVDANSNALQVARSGLAEKFRVPMEFSQTYISHHIQELAQLKTLAVAFVAEARLAELEQRTNDAAQAYVDATRLGIDSRQGGNVIDGLVGMALEAMGTFGLQKIAPNLDEKKSAELARQLETVATDEDSWLQIRENEKYWSRRAYPGLQYRATALFRWRATKAEDVKIEKKFEAQQNSFRRLILNLAAHAYELDKGHRPTNVAELVPTYLKAEPIDARTGKAMTLTP